MNCPRLVRWLDPSFHKLFPVGKALFVLLFLGGNLFVAGLAFSAEPEGAAASAPVALTKSAKAQIDAALAEKRVNDELQALAKLTVTLSLADIPETLKTASHLRTMRERMVLQYSTLRRWSELAPKDAFEAIAKLPEGRERAQTLQLAANRFAQQYPQAAAAAALALPPGKSRQSAVAAVADAWAKSDGKKALAWANGLPDGLKDSALYALRFSWVHADPVAASADVAALPPGNMKNALTANIAEEWTTLDSVAAMQWAKDLPEGPERGIALSNAARTMADKDPEGAANFALTLDPPALRQNAVIAVVTNWTTQQPREAGDWLVAQTNPDIQKAGFPVLMNFWAVIAPAEAGEWVAGIKSPATQATVLQFYAQTVAPWAPDLGAKLVVQLAPDMAGQPAALECAHQWMGLDPATAKAWIAASKLPDELKQKWLSPAPPTQPQ
jgi:hypothetical protein